MICMKPELRPGISLCRLSNAREERTSEKQAISQPSLSCFGTSLLRDKFLCIGTDPADFDLYRSQN